MVPKWQRCGVCENCLRPQQRKGCLALKEQRAEVRNLLPCGRCTNCTIGQACLVPLARNQPERRSAVRSGGHRAPVADKTAAVAAAGAREEQEDAGLADKHEGGSPEAGQQQQQPGGDGGMEPIEAGGGTRRFEHDYRQLLFVSSYDLARRQHMSNLVFLLRHCAAVRDWRRLAGVSATLMVSDRPENLSDHWVFRHPESRARLAEALGAGWLLLQQQHPGALSYEQTLRLLKQWAAFQLAPAGREAVFLELAQFSRAQGHATDAWDFLSSQLFTTAAAEAQRIAIMASIRMDKWAEIMRGVAEVQQIAPQLPSSPNKRRRSGPARAAASWQPWQHNAQLWARGGRLAKELHQEALDCCTKALEQEPAASGVALHMAQLQLAADDAKGALGTARRLQSQATDDFDATGLLALLLVARPMPAQQQQQQPTEEEQQENIVLSPSAAAAEAADCCYQLLAVDPSCHTAAAALLSLHEQHPLPASLLAVSCCIYLEAQPPSWLPSLLELRAWQHLAAALTQVSAAVVGHSLRLRELREQRQSLLPHSFREAQRLSQGHAEVSTRGKQRWQQLQQLGIAAVEEQGQLQEALAMHRQCCSVLEARLWWLEVHLLPQPADTIVAALQQGSANPAALLAQAAVHAVLHPLWQQRMVSDWRASDRTSALPRLVQNLMAGHTVAALEQTGHKEEAAALRAAAKLCRKASAAAAGVSMGATGNDASTAAAANVAALASVARQRVDFWRAARKPWKPPPGWLPVAQGSMHPPLGHIATLPPQWWVAFPQFRHRQQEGQWQQEQQQPQQGEVDQQGAQAHLGSPVIGAAFTPPRGSADETGTLASKAGQLDSSAWQQQQQRLLRRMQQPGVRSILKGSQPELGIDWEASPQLPGEVLVGSDPISGSARPGRRVQFQLPEDPMHGDDDGGTVSQARQVVQAAAAAEEVGASGSPHATKGKRRLLPQLPASLAQVGDTEEGSAGRERSGGASWRRRLQQRRRTNNGGL